MLLIMRNFFIKTILVSFCFVSFNTQAFESIYLICSGNNQTMVFGIIETLRDKYFNMGSKGSLSATGYLANSKVNEFDKKIIGFEGRSGDASVRPKELIYSDYKIDRVTGELNEWWVECDTDVGDRSCETLGEGKWVTKSKLIGSCNKISKSEAKAKAKQLYTPTPEPKTNF